MSKAKAAVFIGANQDFAVHEYEVVPPAAGQALLELVASGICGTDIHIADGRLPFPAPTVIGHEFIGRIAALGADAAADGLGDAIAVGDTVVACIALACGKCLSCRQGETASCMSFGVTNAANPDNPPHFHGGYAECLHQPAHTLVKVPAGVVPLAAAAFPCAGPTAIRAFEYGGGLESGELVVVQGLGPVGLFAVAWAAVQGCQVLAIGSGRSPERLAMAAKLGAIEVIDYQDVGTDQRRKLVLDLASRLGRGDGADVVFEASGAPTAITEGMNLLRTRGRYLIPGQYSLSGKVEISPELITFRALRLIGSGQYTLADIATYLKFLHAQPQIANSFAACVTGKYSVAQVNAALAAVRVGGGIKTVLV